MIALMFMRRMSESVQVEQQICGAAEKLERTLERMPMGVRTSVLGLGGCRSWTPPGSRR